MGGIKDVKGCPCATLIDKEAGANEKEEDYSNTAAFEEKLIKGESSSDRVETDARKNRKNVMSKYESVKRKEELEEDLLWIQLRQGLGTWR